MWGEEKLLLHLTLKHERTDKIRNSQGQCQLFKTTRKDETMFLRAHGIGEVVMDTEKSRLSRVLLTVCRLVRI